jgi:hypothetical protein
MTDEIKVFISYSREDYETAKRLYDDLEDAGVKPWMDQEDLLVGQKWKEGVRQAIKESDYFLAVISSKAIEKTGYYQTELSRALKELEEQPPDKIYILPVRVDECIPKHEMLRDLNWADLFPSYDNGLAKLIRVFETLGAISSPQTAKPVPKEPGTRLRTEPRTLSDDDVRNLIKEHDFFCKKYDWTKKWANPSGNFKKDLKDNGEGTITDRATGLMWQQVGSESRMAFKDAPGYVEQMNQSGFAGYSDWRLPTLEELASLLESEKKDGLYINPLFDRKQRYCWSADHRPSGGAWRANFDVGSVYWDDFNAWVRLVRRGQ